MNKITILLLLGLLLTPSVFADENDDIETFTEKDTASEDKTFGAAVGVRFSVLGLEPVVDVNISHLELEGTCIFNTGLKGDEFGYAPSFSIGFNTNPFEPGSTTVLGGEYMYLSPMYTNMITKITDKDNENTESLPAVHAVSLFYRGGVNFTSHLGMNWRVRLPLFIAGKQGDESFNVNISNLMGFGICCLTGLCTVSLGLRVNL